MVMAKIETVIADLSNQSTTVDLPSFNYSTSKVLIICHEIQNAIKTKKLQKDPWHIRSLQDHCHFYTTYYENDLNFVTCILILDLCCADKKIEIRTGKSGVKLRGYFWYYFHCSPELLSHDDFFYFFNNKHQNINSFL